MKKVKITSWALVWDKPKLGDQILPWLYSSRALARSVNKGLMPKGRVTKVEIKEK